MSEDLPLVSVIMNAYNAEEYLNESISSVLDQTYHNWEIILWDNKSTDRTAEIINSFDDSRIRYYLASNFTPLGEARNLAISKAQGSLIAFLDCDDLWFPDKLFLQVPLFEDLEIGIVICDSIFFNSKGDNFQIYKKNKPPTGFVFKKLFSEYFISLETAIVRKSAFKDLDHIFDKSFQMVEEYDLFVRISLDWKLDYVDKVLAKWRVHEKSWTWSRDEIFPKERKLMLEKYIKQIPSFEEDYPDEIRLFKRTYTFEEALIDWREKKNYSARGMLKDYIFDGYKWMFLYILTFLPISAYDYLQKVRGSVRPD